MPEIKPEFGQHYNEDDESIKDSALFLAMLTDGDLNDYSGNIEADKTINNGAVWAPGDDGPALEFVASESDFITGPLTVSQPLTIITRFKTGASGTARPFNIGDLTLPTTYIAVDANVGTDFSFWVRVGSGAEPTMIYTDEVPTANTWYTMAVTTELSDHKCYLNGNLVITRTDSRDLGSLINGFGIGALVRPVDVFSDCIVSYVQCHNRILSEEELKNYNPYQAWQDNSLPLWVAAQGGVAPPTGGVNLLDGLFHRKRLIA
jgi:hypothetical protein